MLGAITGDTIGSSYEFQNTKDYNFEMFRNDSNYTDDSIMTMAVAKWLLDDPEHSLQGLEDTMVAFSQKFTCPMGGYGYWFSIWLYLPEKLGKYDSENGKIPYHSAQDGIRMGPGATAQQCGQAPVAGSSTLLRRRNEWRRCQR